MKYAKNIRVTDIARMMRSTQIFRRTLHKNGDVQLEVCRNRDNLWCVAVYIIETNENPMTFKTESLEELVRFTNAWMKQEREEAMKQ